LVAIIGATAAVAAVIFAFTIHNIHGLNIHDPTRAVPSSPQNPAQQNGTTALRTTSGSYIGLYSDGDPASYTGVNAFIKATGVRPQIVSYYSGWLEPFQASFAATAAKKGAVPLVQIDPTGISISAIASGQYDAYLDSYATAVRAYRHPIVLSFGHEMNGYWYSWGYLNTPARVFVAAWRHIVKVFRAEGARNVTWLWTVNIIHKRARVPSPGPWWPGSSYVNWVGIDGYYDTPSATFASLFGPTIAAVRIFTHAPILIAETAVKPAPYQAAKVADLYAGIRLYDLLGFIWFDSVQVFDWRLKSPAAIAAFRRGAESFQHLSDSHPAP
jgi:mannan endo-1,4-beta-mannosidase